MNKGDIVLINFPFTDLSESKLRPVLVLGRDRDDLLVCFISSKVNDKDVNDIVLKKNERNNLMVDSTVKCFKIYTLHSNLVERKIGFIDKRTYQLVVQKITKLIN